MSGRRQLSNPRGRQLTEQHPLQPNETSQPQSKRRRLGYHSSGSHYPPAFWDSLSKIWLTKDALKELDKRSTQSVPNLPPPYRRAHRPVTRRFLANLKSSEATYNFLYNYAPRTLKDVKLFARHGGPDLSGLRGVCNVRNLISGAKADDTLQYPEPIHPLDYIMRSRSSSSRHRKQGSMPTSKSRPTTTNTTTTKNTKSSRPKDPNYQQKLIDSGVLPDGYEYPDGHEPPLPQNWDEINRRLAQPRLSPSVFPEEKYQAFVRKDKRAFNEDAVKDSVLPAMLETMSASGDAQKNIWFTNIDPITDDIAHVKPDYYYGAQPEQIHQNVRDQLSKHIVPSNHTHLPAVPNLFLEVKGPSGNLAEAERQALHDGAIGARAIQSLQSYGQDEPIFDNNAYTISLIYHSGTLKMYSHSVAQPNGPGTQPEYYMHQITTWGMTGNRDTFRDGAKAFKNAKDWARGARNAAIARANEIAAHLTEDEEEDEDEEETEDDEGGGTDDDQAEAESSNTMFSFNCGTSQVSGMPVEDEDESETSVDDDSQHRPSAKRSLSMSHWSHQRQRKTSKHIHQSQPRHVPSEG
ncbi:MAG: hypothetical protein LQ342_003623 [Letrouitia transgressa]|nr:MAG: hypothetical protein LQ342_003623 [Letrouitia transgressa]